MRKDGRSRKRASAMTFVRPLVMLTGGALAAVAAWYVLMREPPVPGQRSDAGAEHLSQQDRAALDAVLRHADAGRPTR